MRSYAALPGLVEVQNLVVTLPDNDAEAWNKWHEAFVTGDGNGRASDAGAGGRRNGTLSYLSPDGSTYFAMTFRNLGLFKLTPEKVEAGSENIRRVKGERVAESVAFDFNPAAGF